jgi:ABC-type antimicrobial peptide transport system permease subunit
VSQDVPDRPASGGLIQALSVPRNATIGLVTGLLLAVGAYLVRVLELLGPFAGTRQYPGLGAEGYFAMLAFVLATATALLVTALLTVVSAYRLTRELE